MDVSFFLFEIHFAFVYLKIDIIPRKRSRTIAQKYHYSMTVRDIAAVVGVGKSNVSRILTRYNTSGLANHRLPKGEV